MKRVISVFLVLIFICPAFCVSSSGADNLVSPDTSHFDYEYITFGDTAYTSYTPSFYVYNGRNCFLYPTPLNAGRIHVISDLTGKIYSGKTYEFSVDLWFSTGFSWVIGNIRAHVAIFSGSWSSYTEAFTSSSSTTLASFDLFEIDCDYPNAPWNSNYDYGTVNSTFTVPNLTGTYSAFLVFASVAETDVTTSSYCILGVDDMKLIDVDDNSSELDGIKGFLHNIYWDLRGGDCGEACSPHLGLFDRLKNYILYFNAEGTYTNPFEGTNMEFRETVDGWLSSLNSFCDSIDNSGQKFSSYISNVTVLINGFTGAIPILGAFLTFSCIVIVVRKVISR